MKLSWHRHFLNLLLSVPTSTKHPATYYSTSAGWKRSSELSYLQLWHNPLKNLTATVVRNSNPGKALCSHLAPICRQILTAAETMHEK